MSWPSPWRHFSPIMVSYCLDVSHSSLSSSFRPSEPLRQNFEWVDLEPHTTPAAPLRSPLPQGFHCLQHPEQAHCPGPKHRGSWPSPTHLPHPSQSGSLRSTTALCGLRASRDPSILLSITGSTWPRGPHGYFYCHRRFSHCLGLPFAAYHFPPPASEDTFI